jgi:CHAT domain-containing protein
MPLSQAEKALERRDVDLAQRWRTADTDRAALQRQAPFAAGTADPRVLQAAARTALDVHEPVIALAEVSARSTGPSPMVALAMQLSRAEADLSQLSAAPSCVGGEAAARAAGLLARIVVLRASAGPSGSLPAVPSSPHPAFPFPTGAADLGSMIRVACNEQGQVQIERTAPDSAAVAALGRPPIFEVAEAISLDASQSVLRSAGESAVALHYLVTAESVRVLLVTTTERRGFRVEADRSALNALVDQFRSALASPRGNVLPLAQRLHRLLVQPITGELQRTGARLILVSLDGKLRYLPFAALHDGQHWLVERFAFVSSIPVTHADIGNTPPRQLRMAGFGASAGGAGLSPLPGVRDELHAIVNDGASGAHGLVPGIVRLDADFTVMALRDALAQGFSVLHIASHFALDPLAAAESFLLLGNGDKLSLRAIQDGALDLNGIDLVALSACQTGLDVQNSYGQEFDGLAAVLRRRGAANVMSTLWEVDDASTARLMEQFYRERMAGGRSFGDALRRAQLALVRGSAAGVTLTEDRSRTAVPIQSGTAPSTNAARPFAHPFFWAPFILAGSPR